MSPTNVELYEALKPTVGEDAARMMADAWPMAAEVATKSELREAVAELRAEIHKEASSTRAWMLGFFIPVWAGTWATTVAVILKF